MTTDAIIELHDRLVEQYNLNPTENGRKLIATCEVAFLAAEAMELAAEEIERGEEEG